MGTQTRHHGFAITTAHLYQHTQFFTEQNSEQLLVTTTLQYAWFLVVIRVLIHRIDTENVGIDRHTTARGKGHFGSGSQQATIRTIMVRQQQTVFIERLNGCIERLKLLGIIHIRGILTRGIEHLGQRRTAQTVLAVTQVDEDQFAIRLITIQ